MSRRRKKTNDSGGGGSPSWMVTFSDLMSLLLTFFILLFSMSNISESQFSNVASSFQAVLTDSGGETIIEGQGSTSGPLDLPGSSSSSKGIGQDEEMYKRVSEYIGDGDLGSDVSAQISDRGVFVELKDAILFEPGSASLKVEGVEVLQQLKDLISGFDNEIMIEGYTDDVPMASGVYDTNWELSTARAVSVVRYLVEEENIDPNRLSAVGYGEYRPIVSNDSVENRAKNRRVNILIVFDEESDT